VDSGGLDDEEDGLDDEDARAHQHNNKELEGRG
jgi:hypothetical protein